MLHDGYVLKLVIGFPWKIYLFLSAKKVFSFAHTKDKKKTPMPKSLSHCRCCVNQLPLFEANAHQSSHVSTIINSSMAGRIYSSVPRASVTDCSSNWGNFLWLTGCCKCLVGFLFLHLHSVIFSDIVNWIPALIDERGPPQAVLSGKQRESSISEVGQWTFFALQHDSRDITRSFFLSSWENQSKQNPI